MHLADITNGLFECIGGIMIWINVRQLAEDKEVKGVHWLPTFFFTSWGYWNLYYYPSLNQLFSFIGGLFIVSGNTAWVYLMMKYWKNKREK
jgi:hypothetical protein